ncbi:MAG TPA: PPOX class F420-dependent oxidoreductase [Polyangiaceae bacterium]|jgi:hypothetical protein
MTTDPSARPALADETYVSLETFRKDGSGVKTPVWAAPLDGTLVVFCAGDSFKVKRLRNDPRCRLAGCDVRGKVHGDWHDGTGRVIDDSAHVTRILAALRAKYGLLFAVTDFFSALTGKKKKRAYLELTLTA